LAWAEELERRCHYRARARSARKSSRVARRSDDIHSRHIEAEVGDILIGCLYLPNGNPAPGPKFDYKLRWFERLTHHADTLLATNTPVVLAGAYNVMPTELDVYKPERWINDALFLPEVRQAFARLMAHGWKDATREMHPGERIHTLLFGITFEMPEPERGAPHRSFASQPLRRWKSAWRSRRYSRN
jgi:exonuclease III